MMAMAMASKSSDMIESPSERHSGDISRRKILSQSVTAGGIFLFCLPSPATALSASEASKAYDSYASNYDSLDGGSASTMLGIDQARTDLFKQAKGKVLEIGAGTGLNLGKYDLSKIESLTLLDISPGMLSMAEQRWKNMTIATSSESFISFVQADATSELVSKFGALSFDTVVDSFSLCTMGNDGAEKCLSQLSQVVKSKEQGGQVLLLENSRSSNPFLARYQDATSSAAAEMGGKGCVYNQDVEFMIQQSTKGNLVIESQEQYAAGLFRAFRCTVW
ncbi:unnamed protein product [Cylindrotheca closterium]|uniref:Methyltransferase domain-containing protein n=1 Tax=Cylindrotheca closterium TaxID=2856 RepID=A0AAD2CKR1_9STRA|nr:unnamed protein product [Cylindrotheca closterium]